MILVTSMFRDDFSNVGERDINLVDMGRDDVILSCTPGKIVLWFGRQAKEDLVRKVINVISKVDSSVQHEHEVVCDFESISKYESMGYVLTSYAKTRGGYRAIFNIPFSKKNALDHFISLITEELRQSDIKKTLHWNGSIERIELILDELSSLENWELKKIEYREYEK